MCKQQTFPEPTEAGGNTAHPLLIRLNVGLAGKAALCHRGICCPSEIQTAHMAVATCIICPDAIQPQRRHWDFASKMQWQGEKCGTCWCIFTLKEDLPQCNGNYSSPFIRGVTMAANLAQAPLSISSEMGRHKDVALSGKVGNGNSLEVITKDKNGWR